MQLLKRADPTVPIEHTVGALAELVKLGAHSLAVLRNN